MLLLVLLIVLLEILHVAFAAVRLLRLIIALWIESCLPHSANEYKLNYYKNPKQMQTNWLLLINAKSEITALNLIVRNK